MRGDELTYRFGPWGGTPELELSSRVDWADVRPWSGVGRAIHESVAFENRGYRYEVFYSVDRMSHTGVLEGGVVVINQGRHLATVNCVPGRVEADFDLLFAALERLGLCWDHARFEWSRICTE